MDDGGTGGAGRARKPRPRDGQPEDRPVDGRRAVRRGREPRRRSRMHGPLGLSSTRRAAVLALVVIALAFSVAVPLRNYLAQRGALDETVQQQEKLREQVELLERRKTELSDPAQVEAEARERLRYVKPGETPYVVQLPTTTTTTPPAETPRAAPGEEWYGQLWRTIAPGTGQ